MLRNWFSFLVVIALEDGHRMASAFSVFPTHEIGARTFSLQRTSIRASSEEDEDFVRVPRRRQRGRLYDDQEDEDAFYNSVGRRIFGSEEFDEDDEDWDEDEDEEDEEYGIFSNVLIDNPILDNIDPDGAAERFPELARDPRFWIDMVLFIAFINFLSAIGPQDYFPDIPYFV